MTPGTRLLLLNEQGGTPLSKSVYRVVASKTVAGRSFVHVRIADRKDAGSNRSSAGEAWHPAQAVRILPECP